MVAALNWSTNIVRGFLQGNSYSSIGFHLAEGPTAMLLEGTGGYKMGLPTKFEIKRTQNLLTII